MSENSDLLQAGQQLSEPRRINDESIPYIVLPEKCAIRHLEDTLPAPTRIRCFPQFTQVESFIAYVNRHKSPNHTLLFVETTDEGANMTCVLDHHGEQDPQWCNHRANYSTQTTPEWTSWRGNSGVQMAQAQFAAFIENGVKEIITPDGAEMLSLVTRLEGSTSVEFVSGVRLDNGNHELKYVESTSTKGAIQVPQEFEIGLKLFEGSDAYRIRARLRYRINNKALVFWYELIKPHLVVRDAVDSMLALVKGKTELEPLYGTP